MEFEGWICISLWGTSEVEGTLSDICQDIVEQDPKKREYFNERNGKCYDWGFDLLLDDDPQLDDLYTHHGLTTAWDREAYDKYADYQKPQ